MTRKLLAAILLSTAALAAGCATTATGISQSAVYKSGSVETLKVKAPPGVLLAVVRYPAIVEDDAQDAFYKAFEKQAIGGRMTSNSSDAGETQALADSMILKSNYFALSVYKELAAKMPEHSVLLSPHMITLGEDGRLTSEPLTQAESLPNIVAIDFASYTFPDTKKMMGKEPLTFGDLVTPLISVRTDHRAATPTHGLLMASAPIVPRAAGNGRDTVNASIDSLQSGRLEQPVPELDFVAHLKSNAPMSVAQQPFSSRSAHAVSAYPLEKIKLSQSDIVAMNADNSTVIDPMQDAFTRGFANQIIGIINQSDMDKAVMAGRAGAISKFDESLAALTLVGSDDSDYRARYRYAERLLEAEQKYLSVQSLRLFDGIHNGEMGAQVRDMLKAEYDILEKRRKLARQQNTATALAILGAVAAGAAIASDDGQSSYGEKIAINALIQGAIFAGTQAYSYNKRSKGVGSNYLSSVIPALEEQTTVQVNLIDSNETITAIRYEDLQVKLKELYNSKQRSLGTIATRCAYNHSGAKSPGTWLGVCENGLANGSGVGVLRKPDGSAFEYYGYAVNGQADGPGYLITHTASGSYALEGRFVSGLADGAMRVSKSGEPHTIMTYQAGKALGRAAPEAVVLSPFHKDDIQPDTGIAAAIGQ